MKTKITVKTFYLIALIAVGLIALGVGSTYAVFTASAEINNPISLSSNLTYEGEIIETVEVEVLPGNTEYVTLNVTNSTTSTLNYSTWYLEEENIEVESASNNASGTVAASGSLTIGVYVRNVGDTTKDVTVAVSSSTDDIVLSKNMKMITDDGLESRNLYDYINLMYTNSNKKTVPNNSINYSYATDVSIMDDRLGGSLTTAEGGNLRYYGASPDNYIWYNCTDYNNQSSSTCEKWRIIGIVDGKVKIIRNDSIGSYSWDTANQAGINQWGESTISSTGAKYIGADMMRLLNPGYETVTSSDPDGNTLLANNSLYWNAASGNCYNAITFGYTSCNFTSAGIRNNKTRSMVSDSLWYTGAYTSYTSYPNQLYTEERDGVTRTITSDYVRTDEWTGRVALAYPSDYAYAADLSICSQTLNLYNDSTCANNDWLRSLLGNTTLLNSKYDTTQTAFYIYTSGYAANGYVYNARARRPVLYLDKNVIIRGGAGTSDHPYEINNSENYNAKRFDGVNDYLSLGYGNYDFGKSITIGVRFNSDGTGSGTGYMIDNVQSAGFGLTISPSNNKPRFIVYSSSAAAYKSLYTTNAIEPGKWYNLVATYDGSYLRIYLNGEEAATPLAFTDSLTVSTADVGLGANMSGSIATDQFFPGMISHAFVSSKVMTASEIAANFSTDFNYIQDSNTLIYSDLRD